MKCIVSTACVLSVLVAVSFAAPYFPAQFSASSNLQIGGSGGGSTSVAASGTASTGTTGTSGGGLSDILGSIDIPGLLRSVNSIVKLVGVFCPPLSQVLDNVIQNVTSTAFRVFGRVILRGGLGGGSGGSSGGSTASRVNVVLPTYPPDEDEDYEDEDESTSPADNVDLRISQSTSATQTGQTVVNTTSTLYTSAASDDDNTVAKRHVRVVRAAEKEEAAEEEEEEDQDGAESAPQPAEDLSNVDADDTDRNKRYSPFGGTEHHGAAGSGNFLFDIIRLVAGSGATEESDEKINGPGGVAEVDIAKSVGVDHHGEGIPGPITRLFVIANRGLANLVQDLILRLAQTSERLVNFKARLVTSLI
ncbi:DNA-directed RNA polymerase I subunit rpa1 isoform X3 [Tribolium madens]|uniref:DNA-directed RNA polymerase I subunit rpa1 isoform X3 n=1 Tax=Tribolium madens TaxID=41895 RepID=UPI001CF73A66|nr:DNA-directed RNA polymerase I subunit rpa1 isoform X3 [Tribolium madens]